MNETVGRVPAAPKAEQFGVGEHSGAVKSAVEHRVDATYHPHLTMRFVPWYPLAEAAAHLPKGPGVFQLRVPPARGLLDYPRGRSAMVHYGGGRDLQAELSAFVGTHGDRGLWCRHAVDFSRLEKADPVTACDRLVDMFTRRFGAPPRLPPCD